MLDVVNIGKNQLRGVSGDALKRDWQHFFGQQFVKNDTKFIFLKKNCHKFSFQK